MSRLDERTWRARPRGLPMRFCRSSRVTDLKRRKPANEFICGTGSVAAPDQPPASAPAGTALGDTPARPDAVYLRLLHRLAGFAIGPSLR
jgi:hypothetical protein